MTTQFDMFSGEGEGIVQRPVRRAPARRLPPGALSENDMVEHLIETGRYRILKRLEPRPIASIARPDYPLRGVIVDTETTGLNHRKDEIIEIGAIAFSYDQQGNVGDVTGIYGGLQQPTTPIPADITRLTGITDEMVAGKMIDIQALRALIEPADLVIAHNAGFDRHSVKCSHQSFLARPGHARIRKSTGRHGISRGPSSAI